VELNWPFPYPILGTYPCLPTPYPNRACLRQEHGRRRRRLPRGRFAGAERERGSGSGWRKVARRWKGGRPGEQVRLCRHRFVCQLALVETPTPVRKGYGKSCLHHDLVVLQNPVLPPSTPPPEGGGQTHGSVSGRALDRFSLPVT
jgi:hypothetical protein